MKTTVVFAGGGTAGHVEPALAVADWLRKARPDWQLSFVGTKSGLENQLVPSAGFELINIPKVLMPRQFTPSVLIWPFKLIYATWKSFNICRSASLDARRRHRTRAHGHWLRLPHWIRLPLRGLWLRRLLLSEGREGTYQDGCRARSWPSGARRCGECQRRPEVGTREQDCEGLW